MSAQSVRDTAVGLIVVLIVSAIAVAAGKMIFDVMTFWGVPGWFALVFVVILAVASVIAFLAHILVAEDRP